MTTDTAAPRRANGVWRIITGSLFGIGFTGFLSRWLVEFTLWFRQARTEPRPALHMIYPLREHGVTYFVSAGEILLHNLIFIFWLCAAIGGLLSPRGIGTRKRPAAYDPHHRYSRAATVAGIAMLVFVMFLAHPLGDILVAGGWLPGSFD